MGPTTPGRQTIAICTFSSIVLQKLPALNTLPVNSTYMMLSDVMTRPISNHIDSCTFIYSCIVNTRFIDKDAASQR